MSLLSILSGPSTHELKDEGLLVHDEVTGSWVDFSEHGEESLPCEHVYLRFENGIVECQQCDCSRETQIEPEPYTTITEKIKEVRQ